MALIHSKNGTSCEDPSEAIAQEVDAIHASRPKHRPTLRDLAGMVNERAGLVERESSARKTVTELRPDLQAAESQLKTTFGAIAKLKKSAPSSARDQVIQELGRKVERLEDTVKELSRRIETAKKIADSALSLIGQFDKNFGADIERLKAEERLLDEALGIKRFSGSFGML